MLMPKTITTPEGETFYLTKYRGTTTDQAEKQHGIPSGLVCYEYWIKPDNDSRRLYAVSPDEWFVD